MTPEVAIAEISIKENLEQFLLVLLISLSVATMSRLFPWLRKIPFTLLLVIVGLFLAFEDIHLIQLSPELILEIFLPPLLFEAAWNLNWRDLKRDLFPVFLYATIGVVICVVGIAIGLDLAVGMPIAIALLVGASLSATDPISVVALMKELGAPKRLRVLMEGESLFNDGIAVVAFIILVGFPMGNIEISPAAIVLKLLLFTGIAVVIAGIIGFGISYLTQRFDSPLVEQSLTLLAAYGTYVVTEDLGGSGVIGVVVVGLILGNFGSRIGMNPRSRLIVSEFWEFMAFLVNSIVFLLIGAQIEFASLATNIKPIAVSVLAMMLTRVISTFTLTAISNTLAKSEIDLQNQTMLWWGGLRGSVSIALVLSVPVAIPERENLIATVFGVVLFSLLFQGLTTQPLLQWLGLLKDQPLREEYLQLVARRVALNRVQNHLSQSVVKQELDPDAYQHQAQLIKSKLEAITTKTQQLLSQEPKLQELTIELLQEELVDIEAETYAEFVRSGRLNTQLSTLLSEVMEEKDPETA
ncbi:MAG: cation:proton antiporter [Limnospira sp. PMC 1291.21]|uniref:Na+/H+ antiporter n=3 Tax=Limnospira TaxID=2596745 RepID=B5W1R3_LIMMA|nr:MULTISPECIES: cation:proton antiporter [Limnospira]EKD07997.1 Na+/H+ antiporter [Arthrospira platensis C1]MDC0836260.1 cation:proton antiporter [Limnoraphis robusta]MDY7055092.1 cation:proton antiporter [Limnospira fusiformis LS22]QJB25299.1 sodium:proton antiporter [Limnospira fusiformis SAG 85.79]EDZ94511.1 Na+/H+ antiporter [Limnospira maxima CS-328]